MIICLLSLCAWIWLTQKGLIGGTLVLLILCRYITAWRWDLKLAQFYRIGDFVSVLFVASILYFSFANTSQRPVFILLEWLPVFFMPILLAQLYSVANQLPMGTLFYSTRKREPQRALDFKLPYAAICLISAGVANKPDWTYFAVIVVCFSAILWTVRSKNSHGVLWFIAIIFAASFSYLGQMGLRQLQVANEDFWVEFFSDWQTDPFKSMTSIGDLGSLKLSNKIVFRVKAQEPLLLLQSSYDRYLGQSWLASKRVFSDQENFPDETLGETFKQLKVLQSVKRATILALPPGTAAIKGLEGARLQYTPLGAVKLTEAPDFINYQVDYSGRGEAQLGEFDLQIPEQHQAWLQLIKKELSVDDLPPVQIADSIKRYFQSQYYYSLYLGEQSNADKAIETFMLKRKAGHCEYFAVASVLLLRSYGIPARLANGYAMQEYSATEEIYIVRRRHAHAWAIAAIDGYWQAVDSTPSQWLDMEEEQVAFWQPVYDLFSALHFYYKQWSYQQSLKADNNQDSVIEVLVITLLLVGIFWKLWTSRQYLLQAKAKASQSKIAFDYPGQASKFYLIEQALVNTDKARYENEAIMLWVKRVGNQDLIELSEAHYRCRFNPEECTEEEVYQLNYRVNLWLSKQ